MLKRRGIDYDRVRQRLFLMRMGREIGVKKACERMGKHRSFYYYWNQRYREKGWV